MARYFAKRLAKTKHSQKFEKSGDRRWKVVILLETTLSKINPVLASIEYLIVFSMLYLLQNKVYLVIVQKAIGKNTCSMQVLNFECIHQEQVKKIKFLYQSAPGRSSKVFSKIRCENLSTFEEKCEIVLSILNLLLFLHVFHIS